MNLEQFNKANHVLREIKLIDKQIEYVISKAYDDVFFYLSDIIVKEIKEKIVKELTDKKTELQKEFEQI